MKKIHTANFTIILMATFESKNVHSAFFYSNFIILFWGIQFAIAYIHITTHIIHNIQYCFFDRKILSLQTCIYIRRHVLYYYIIYSSILPSPLSFFEEKKSYILYDNYYMKWKLAPNEIQMELFFTFVCVEIIIISNYPMYL